MKHIKCVYIGENLTLSNGSILNKYDICTFHIVNETNMSCHVINDRTGDNLGVLFYNKESIWFIPLAEWRQQQIDKILEDD